jgi:hypothetical protein
MYWAQTLGRKNFQFFHATSKRIPAWVLSMTSIAARLPLSASPHRHNSPKSA